MQSFSKMSSLYKAITGKTNFHICSLNWTDVPEPYTGARGYMSEGYLIIWITRGKGEYWINLDKWEISDGAVFCIKPGQYHRCDAEGAVEGYAIAFNEYFLGIGDQENDATYRSAMIQVFECVRAARVTGLLLEDMLTVVGSMEREYRQAFSFRDEMLRRYLKVFLIYLARQFEHAFDPAYKTRAVDLVERFLVLLKRDLSVKRMVGDYARQLSVTANYLNEIIKKNTGHSAGYHIRQCIVLEAKRMVTYSDLCTKEVAYHLGFSDMAHFSKFFKQNAGLNFSDFRKQRPVTQQVIKMD